MNEGSQLDHAMPPPPKSLKDLARLVPQLTRKFPAPKSAQFVAAELPPASATARVEVLQQGVLLQASATVQGGDSDDEI
jgi:hypothetical protein